MGQCLFVSSIEVDPPNDTSDFIHLDDIFLLVDGRLGIRSEKFKVSFDDRPLQNLYILKNAISAINFGQQKIESFQLPSWYSGDSVSIATMDYDRVTGSISTMHSGNVSFACSTKQLAADVGASLKTIKRALESHKISLHRNWPAAHIFGGLEF